MENNEFLSVSEINRYISYKFDSDQGLQKVYVEGELSNVKKSGSHYYFSLKDAQSEISAMFFYPANMSLTFIPQDGQKVHVAGKVSVYQKRGTYSINVTAMEEIGLGLLYKAYLELKDKLSKEGLFDSKYKLPLPEYPKCVGIITAPTGEAINDIISTFNRRLPLAKLKLFPSLVQGVDAPKDLVRALNLAYLDDELDCLIIGRGGGSFEDLNAFNDENLARLLFKSKIPTVSAVGHEGDYTICDFVCSFRAPTPTGAAMVLTKEKGLVNEMVLTIVKRLNLTMKQILTNSFNNYDNLTKRLQLLSPDQIMANLNDKILNYEKSITSSFDKLVSNYDLVLNNYNTRLSPELINGIINNYEVKFNHLIEKCTILNPLNIIQKGYSIVYKDNEVVSSISHLNESDSIKIKFSDGIVDANVTKINKDN